MQMHQAEDRLALARFSTAPNQAEETYWATGLHRQPTAVVLLPSRDLWLPNRYCQGTNRCENDRS